MQEYQSFGDIEYEMNNGLRDLGKSLNKHRKIVCSDPARTVSVCLSGAYPAIASINGFSNFDTFATCVFSLLAVITIRNSERMYKKLSKFLDEYEITPQLISVNNFGKSLIRLYAEESDRIEEFNKAMNEIKNKEIKQKLKII